MHESGLPVKANAYGETMFVRPRNPDDHRQFERLLPRITPLFVYADEDGREWVRWQVPAEVAIDMGWGDMKCACCGDNSSAIRTEHGTQMDTAWDEISWWFDARDRVSGV